MFSAKIRCFQHYVSDNRLLLVFVRKLCFWPFIDNMFWCVGNEIGSFERYVTKKQRFGFRCKIPFFQSPSTKNKFWFVGNEIKLLWGLNHKKERFCFFVAKTRCFSFIAATCRKIGLFPVLLHQKNVFCQFAVSHFNFFLILLKTTFSFLFGQVTLFSTLCLWETAFSFFSYLNCAFTLYLTETMFWFFCDLIGSFEPYVTKNSY